MTELKVVQTNTTWETFDASVVGMQTASVRRILSCAPSVVNVNNVPHVEYIRDMKCPKQKRYCCIDELFFARKWSLLVHNFVEARWENV